MENPKKKMIREVSHDRLTPKKRDDLVQSEIFGDFEEDGLDYEVDAMTLSEQEYTILNK